MLIIKLLTRSIFFTTVLTLFICSVTVAQNYQGSIGPIPDNGPAGIYTVTVSALNPAILNGDFGLKALNVDEHGLDEMDNRILSCIIDKFKGGPVGITTIATACGEEAGTIEEVYEPFLIQEGYLKRTPRGREATDKSYRHLNKKPPGNMGGVLFEIEN